MPTPSGFLSLLVFLALTLLLTQCNNASKTSTAQTAFDLTDTLLIAAGQEDFETYCITCHAIKGDGSGPALGGITVATSPEWVAKFIANPQEMIASGDPRAVQVDQAYPAIMPAFQYMAESEIYSIVAYLHSKRDELPMDASLPPGLEDPIPGKIPLSDVVVDLEEVMQMPATAEKRPMARINKMVPNPIGDLFLQDLNGVLYLIREGQPSVFLDVRDRWEHFVTRPGLATGFGSFAFHPEYEHNGLLYTTHTERSAAKEADFVLPDSLRALQWVLMEWRADAPHRVHFTGTSRELMRIDYPGTIHGLQNIAFNPMVDKDHPDYGNLYLGAGDGSAVLKGHPTLVEGAGSIWGSLLRIDPAGTNSTNGQYGIPSDNPFADTSGAIREIYAHGFRNPHQFTWRADGAMILTNIGERNLESIYLVEKGADYGWPRREGSLMIRFADESSEVYPLPDDDQGYSYPATQFDHDEGRAICGGYIYQGEIAELRDKYLFGDIVSGRLFFLSSAELRNDQPAQIREWRVRLGGKLGTLREHFGKGRIDLRFGYDGDGEYYLMTKFDGRVYRIADNASST